MHNPYNGYGFYSLILWGTKSGTSCTLHGEAPPPLVKAHSDTPMSRLWGGTIWKAYNRLFPKWRQTCYELTYRRWHAYEDKSSRFPLIRIFFRVHLNRHTKRPYLGTPTSLTYQALSWHAAVPLENSNQFIVFDNVDSRSGLRYKRRILSCRYSTS